MLRATPRQLDHTRDASATCRRPSACNVRGMSDNTFDARADLEVGDATYEIYRLDALQSKLRRRAAAVLAEGPAREPAAQRGRRRRPRGGHRGARDAGTRSAEPSQGDRLHARARGAAGLHRRARASSTSPRCATRWPTLGGDPTKINPLVPAELVIDHSVQVDAFGTPRRVPASTPSSSSSATRSATRSCAGARTRSRTSGRPARHRHRPPGQPRVPRARRVRRRRDRRSALPRHARRHRLAHDDDQRPRRARLGRRRHRGRGGDARPADVDADPAGASASSSHGELPEGATATDLVLTVTADAARARRRRQVRRVLRRRASPNLPLADRATIGNMSPEFGSTCAIFPIDAETLRYLRVLRPPAGADRRSSRPTPRSRACGTTRTPRSRRTPRRSSSTSATSCRRSPARSARRTASR